MNGDYRRGNDRGGRGGGGGYRGGPPRGPGGGGGYRGRDDRFNERGGDRGGERGGDRGGDRRGGVPLSDLDPNLTDLSRRVIGCAIEVHKDLGPGYPADVYRKALEIEFKHEKIESKRDHGFEVDFDGEVVGTVHADLFIGGRFIVKLMAEHTEIGTQPRHELRALLRAADLELGLIINFGERRLKDGLVRVLNPDKLRELAGETDEDEYEDDEFEDEEGDEADAGERSEG